ncbi:hypothetical protein LOOC260_117980 [Paucilactobacillus hokkaidonensis JCM 18461]|uniref:Uncharacterized protein n=2 Tax=Paucilactobacillus hokkaidonensis TaxID=1193095 RepID=A0A0A1GZ82_9LACO|nr:ABC transporter permease [Paucilactobacillus hokkaidonensis]KRO08169.1 hypothetical protein IV59_GL001487 [Paucilactobacillus hokkaidonensis]BAP86304.1 hypothetical protein LOOC260_117980 [Paucilactobacillus hokkaidonensis JCM 18461]
MFNMIRGDAYQLRHSKGFYITEISLIILVLSSVLTGTLGSIGVRTEGLQKLQGPATTLNAIGETQLMTCMGSFLIYLILPLFIMTTGSEFSHHSYKNLLSSGMTRINYFFSKYAVFIVIVLLQFIIFYATVYLSAGFKNGFGVPTDSFEIKIFQTIIFQLLLMTAIFSVSILILFTTFSTITAVIATIVFPIIVQIIHSIFIKAEWIKYFDFQSMIDGAYFSPLSAHEMVLYLFTTLGTIILCGLLSIYIFSQKNL